MKNILLISVLYISAISLSAQTNFTFSGTRTSSVGEAFIGLADDENAIFYNPAGLVRVQHQKIALSGSYQNYSWNIFSFSQRGLSLQLIRKGIGISLNIWMRGDWKEQVLTGEASPEPIDTYRMIFQDRFFTLSYAKKIFHNFSLGISGKYIFTLEPDVQIFHQNKLLKDTQGITIDLGMLYKISNRFSCGMTLQNIISSELDYVIFSDFGEYAFPNELPVNFSVGFSWLPVSNLALLLDIKNLLENSVIDNNHQVDYTFRRSYHLGCEWNCIANLVIDLGYHRSSRPSAFYSKIKIPFVYHSYNTYSFGIGYQLHAIQLNIGLVADDRASKMKKYPINLSKNTLTGSFSFAWQF